MNLDDVLTKLSGLDPKARKEVEKLAIEASLKSGMKGLKSAQLGQSQSQSFNRVVA